MGGYLSGRQASSRPSIEDHYSIDVCLLYRRGFLEPGVENVFWFPDGYEVLIACRTNYRGWPLCITVVYLSRLPEGKVRLMKEVIGVEMVDVLNGRAQRPYFHCPKLGKRVGVLILGNKGFAHRTYYRYLYRIQRQGHFDRSVTSGRKVKEKLGGSDREAATDPPDRPKGMQWKTFNRLRKKHAKAVAPIMEKIGHML